MIDTERLVLRPWREADRAAFAAMITDAEVGDWLGGARTPSQADEEFDRMRAFWVERGQGHLAVERRSDGLVVGRVTCRQQPPEWEHPYAGVHEVGWMLARPAWGAGYATEAAAAMLRWGFETLQAPDIYAWTATRNLRSQAVMRRIGMTRSPEHDFDHPALAADHPLRWHVVYVARRPAGQ
ncbi:MAG TPA: GNAT family N-acetyltransferase [Caulobacteraceae bacterium]|nr:GNAT family N-acetyltransferase [Caulobacteraceae bacterium]